LNLVPAKPIFSASLETSERGSDPGDKIKTIGHFSFD